MQKSCEDPKQDVSTNHASVLGTEVYHFSIPSWLITCIHYTLVRTVPCCSSWHKQHTSGSTYRLEKLSEHVWVRLSTWQHLDYRCFSWISCSPSKNLHNQSGGDPQPCSIFRTVFSFPVKTCIWSLLQSSMPNVMSMQQAG